MSIKIPETIITYCENKQNTEAMDLMINNNGCKSNSPLKIDEYYQAYLFTEKFIYDMWKFRLDLWKAVWEKLLSNYEIVDCCEKDDYVVPFYVAYKIKTKTYRFQIVNFDGEDDELFILASELSKNDNEKSAISYTQIKDYNNLKNENYTDSKETYTRGVTSINMKNKTEITEEYISKLQEEAKTILKALSIF